MKFPAFTNRLRQKLLNRVPEISKKTGISDPLLRKYLKGTIPGVNNLKLLAEEIPCSTDWLLFGVNEFKIAEKGADYSCNPLFDDIKSAYETHKELKGDDKISSKSRLNAWLEFTKEVEQKKKSKNSIS